MHTPCELSVCFAGAGDGLERDTQHGRGNHTRREKVAYIERVKQPPDLRSLIEELAYPG